MYCGSIFVLNNYLYKDNLLRRNCFIIGNLGF